MWLKLKSLPGGPSGAFEGRRVRYKGVRETWAEGRGDDASRVCGVEFGTRTLVYHPYESGVRRGWAFYSAFGALRGYAAGWLGDPRYELWVLVGCNEERALKEVTVHVAKT